MTRCYFILDANNLLPCLPFDAFKCKEGFACFVFGMYSIQIRFLKTMDWRIVAVFTPIVLAISWAVFNIGRAALGQLQLAVKNFKKNQS